MLKEQRLRLLSDYVALAGAVAVRDAARIFGVCAVTARRDLAELARRGDVQLVHGGAVRHEQAPRALRAQQLDARLRASAGNHRARVAARALTLNDLGAVDEASVYHRLAEGYAKLSSPDRAR
jgi:DeoR/GlpR family transcriptional regulator of sugar metabolism